MTHSIEPINIKLFTETLFNIIILLSSRRGIQVRFLSRATIFLFSKASTPAMRPTQLRILLYMAFFLRGQSGRSSLPGGGGAKCVKLYLFSPYDFLAWCLIITFSYHISAILPSDHVTCQPCSGHGELRKPTVALTSDSPHLPVTH